MPCLVRVSAFALAPMSQVFVPFMHAFSQWLRTATSESRERLAPHGSLDDLVPALKDPSGGLALLQIGTAVDDLQADGPTVLV